MWMFFISLMHYWPAIYLIEIKWSGNNDRLFIVNKRHKCNVNTLVERKLQTTFVCCLFQCLLWSLLSLESQITKLSFPPLTLLVVFILFISTLNFHCVYLNSLAAVALFTCFHLTQLPSFLLIWIFIVNNINKHSFMCKLIVHLFTSNLTLFTQFTIFTRSTVIVNVMWTHDNVTFISIHNYFECVTEYTQLYFLFVWSIFVSVSS